MRQACRCALGFAVVAAIWMGSGESEAWGEMLYVSNTNANSIVRLDDQGNATVFTQEMLNRPTGLGFDSASNLYLANNGSYDSFKYSLDGQATELGWPGLQEPRGIAIDAGGNAYVANFQFGANNAFISRFTPTGERSVFADVNGSPWGLTFDKSGNLYVASGRENTIQKITPDGSVSVFASTGMNQPFGLAFDNSGNLYAANFGNHSITRFTPDGVGSVFSQTQAYPAGLACDSLGNLYVSSLEDGTIEEITPDGTRSTFASGLDGPTFMAFGPDYVYFDAIADGVPEPASLGVLGLSMAAMLLSRRRR